METKIEIKEFNLPTRLENGLRDYLNLLESTFGDEIVSIAIYGSLATGEFFPETSDINLFVVLKDVSLKTLSAIQRDTMKARRKYKTAAFFVSEENVRSSTDVFPNKFLEMKEHHKLIFGTDVLGGLEIHDSNLRLRTEQELKTMLLSLRKFYMQRAHVSADLARILSGYTTALVHQFRAILRLKGKEIPAGRGEILAAGAECCGLDKGLLQRLYELKKSPKDLSRAELDELADRLHELLKKAAAYADKL